MMCSEPKPQTCRPYLKRHFLVSLLFQFDVILVTLTSVISYCIIRFIFCSSLTRKPSWRKGGVCGICIRLVDVAAQICEIAHSEKNRLVAVHGHQRSSTFVPIKSAYATFYLSLIVTFDVSRTFSYILTHKARKWLIFHAPLIFHATAR